MRITTGGLVLVLAVGLGGCGGDETGGAATVPAAPTSIPPVDIPESLGTHRPGLEAGFPLPTRLMLAGATASGGRSTFDERWIAITRPPTGDAESCSADSTGLLVAAGYSVDQRVDLAGGHAVRFRNADQEVDVTANDDAAGGCRLTYQVRVRRP